MQWPQARVTQNRGRLAIAAPRGAPTPTLADPECPAARGRMPDFAGGALNLRFGPCVTRANQARRKASPRAVAAARVEPAS